ncbi:MAG TPA: nucleotidyltransferase domain-containing protein [Patescibacteria group bacterium]|nr:nucleotidyltransferase domain-containing protein [Patescibacteria group bacterium]
MREFASQTMMIPERGIHVLLPPHATAAITERVQSDQPIDPLDSERLAIITEDPTLRFRFPTYSDGKDHMPETCVTRTAELRSIALHASSVLIESMSAAEIKKPFSVLLFGSVAKGLARYAGHTDESDIDIMVLSTLTKKEKNAFWNAFFRRKPEMRRTIELDYPNVRVPHISVNYQDSAQLLNGHYKRAISLIGSSATVLYDPNTTWEQIEAYALRRSKNLREMKSKIDNPQRTLADTKQQNGAQILQLPLPIL